MDNAPTPSEAAQVIDMIHNFYGLLLIGLTDQNGAATQIIGADLAALKAKAQAIVNTQPQPPPITTS